MIAFSNRALLITRPFQDSVAFSDKIHRLNSSIKTICSPLFEIEKLAVNRDLAKMDAAVVTSSNAIKSLVQSNIRFNGTMFCVGSSTALLARQAGYMSLGSAGNFEKLIEVIKPAILTNSIKSFVYFRGEEIVGDLGEGLRELNCHVDEVICYRKLPIRLPDEIIKKIENKLIIGATFFSQKTVDLFFNCVKYIPKGFVAFCISTEVSKNVLAFYPDSCLSIRVANKPTVNEMRKLVIAAPEFGA